MKHSILLTAIIFVAMQNGWANFISANPSNYASFLNGLTAGDTLHLIAGTYTNRINLSNKNGTALNPIVIEGEGPATVFLSNACCNTIEISNCSYLVFRNFKIDGQNINYVDGVKASGGGNKFAHHITLERLLIVNNGGNIDGDNQTVGISTKCAAWNWTIRGCIIIAAGTGIYLGNSDGTCPFVSGLIENNLIINTRGYNMEIKEQLDNVRAIFPETSTDSQTTIIRYNVWSKESGSTQIGQGDGSRPCLLMDNFPTTGFGSHDMYEVYGNFFYENPTEALMQVTGNTTAYDNVFVNQVAPSGYPAIVMNNHNGFPPRYMNVFHNTVLTNSDEAGIGLYSPNSNYQQYSYANAVFSNGTPITGFKPANTVDNITDTYDHAINYINSPSLLPDLDVYPLSGQLIGSLTDLSRFTGYIDYDIDFNGDIYDWTFRGAYSGSGINPGRPLQLDTMPTPHGTITGTADEFGTNDFLGIVYPNPAGQSFNLDVMTDRIEDGEISICTLEGQVIQRSFVSQLESGKNSIHINLPDLAEGFYLVMVKLGQKTLTRKLLVQR